ncbi:Protein phosphatase, putative [Hondaea fermentalgiana]|uniref:Protein phosphatase, putative n=1 Tax=Hondaea fermentalgiana TaxID=2315210 RepID=A0A2R5G828_9STRA|nr:Protein phosphatase, putative [Hondaea fermentalgiana]|eukprot:GBG25948.1 Protein phosphatase, putative [Hondaea fermentalgiana]
MAEESWHSQHSKDPEAREREDFGANGEFACIAKQGKRDYMEDCFSTHLSAGKDNIHLFGVYDGHGGSLCAEFCADELLHTLAQHAQLETNPKRAMQAAFEFLDSVFCELSHEHLLQDGSTATVAIVCRDEKQQASLTVGNVGDSRCVLVRAGKEVDVLTRDHLPSLDDEAERIRDQGGMIIMCGGLARVQGCLAVSRALGDASLKPYVTGTPEVVSRKVPMNEGPTFLCIASDGVWDEVSNDEAAEVLLARGAKDGAARLVRLALDRGSDDNLTCMAIDLRALGGSGAGSAGTADVKAAQSIGHARSSGAERKRPAPQQRVDSADTTSSASGNADESESSGASNITHDAGASASASAAGAMGIEAGADAADTTTAGLTSERSEKNVTGTASPAEQAPENQQEPRITRRKLS